VVGVGGDGKLTFKVSSHAAQPEPAKTK
jgi:hypothetical protein